MNTFRIDPRTNKMKFPTEVSPFIFKGAKGLVEQMLKEANEATKADRKIIKEFLRRMTSPCGSPLGIFLTLTIIGIPIYACYIHKKARNCQDAANRIYKTWEEVTKKYNPDLCKLGVFAQLVISHSKVGMKYIRKNSLEFSFNYHDKKNAFDELSVPELNSINMHAEDSAVINSDVYHLEMQNPLKNNLLSSKQVEN